MKYIISYSQFENQDIINEGWKDIVAGIMLSAASILPMKGNINSSETDNKPKTEITSNDKLNAYYLAIGIAKHASELAFKNKDFDAVGAYKEISIYFENLRDGIGNEKLSTNAKKYINL